MENNRDKFGWLLSTKNKNKITTNMILNYNQCITMYHFGSYYVADRANTVLNIFHTFKGA